MAIDWYLNAERACQLAGHGKETQESYIRAVRLLAEHFDKTPDLITEDELQDYFLYRINETKWAPSTLRVSHCGIRFFFKNVLKRKWHTFDFIQAQKEKRLPDILSVEEVRQTLGCVKEFRYYAFLSTVYSLGLRLQEGLYLQVSDIDSSRMMIHVHRGKGAKDRYVPLPQPTLFLLRKYWLSHKNPLLIFPALGCGGGNKVVKVSKKPMSKTCVQTAFRAARFAAGINKRRITVHTLRHSYATHLLEAGVNVRIIQRNMGHANLETTMAYFHLTCTGLENACDLINNIMGGLEHGYH